jgi:serine/threonine protein phosphatase PrpC
VVGEITSLLRTSPASRSHARHTAASSGGGNVPMQYIQQRMPSHTEPPRDEIYIFAVLDGHGFPGEGFEVSAHCGQRLVAGLIYALLETGAAQPGSDCDVLSVIKTNTEEVVETTSINTQSSALSRRANTIKEPILPTFSDTLHSSLLRTLSSSDDVSSAVAATTMALDQRMWLTMEEMATNNGCTLSGAIAHPGGIHLFNIGDSRTLVGARTGPQDRVGTVLGATSDHKVSLISHSLNQLRNIALTYASISVLASSHTLRCESTRELATLHELT